MKKLITLAALSLLATSAFAGSYWGGDSNPDAYGNVLNDLDKPAFVGTGLSVASPRIDAYNGFTSGSLDIDQTGFAIGSTGPEKGHGDTYGSVLHDVGSPMGSPM